MSSVSPARLGYDLFGEAERKALKLSGQESMEAKVPTSSHCCLNTS